MVPKVPFDTVVVFFACSPCTDFLFKSAPNILEHLDETKTAIQQKSKVKSAKFMGQRQMIVENNDKKGMCGKAAS